MNKIKKLVVWLSFSSRSSALLAFIAAFLTCIGANAYCWGNALFSHDSLMIDQSIDVQHNYAIGRFLVPALCMLRGWWASPVIVGVGGALLLSFSIALIVWFLSIRKRFVIILFAALLSLNSCIILINATYINFFDSMMMSLLCSVLAFGFWKKEGLLSGICAVFCLIGTFALYQVYVEVYLTLLVLYIVQKCVNESSLIGLARKVLKSLLILIVSFLFYIALWKLVLEVSGVTLSDASNSLGSIGLLSAEEAIKTLVTAYCRPFLFLLQPATHFMILCGVINFGSLIVGFVGVVILACRSRFKSKFRIALVVVCLLLLPLASDCLSLVSTSLFHGLMIWPWFLLCYVPAALVLNDLQPDFASRTTLDSSLITVALTCFMGIILIGSNWVYGNRVYFEKELQAQATLSVATRIVDRIETIPGYKPGETPVVIIGDINNNPYFKGRWSTSVPVSPLINRFGIDKCYAVGFVNSFGFTYVESFKNYANYILHTPINIIGIPSTNKMDLGSSFEKDPFPSEESIFLCDGVVVVVLS